MRTVRTKKFFERFLAWQAETFSLTSLGLRPYRVYQPILLWSWIFALSCILAIGTQAGRVLALTLLSFLALQYGRAAATARGLRFTRSFPAKAREKDPILIQIGIENESGFEVDSVLLDDLCPASGKAEERISCKDTLPAYARSVRTYRKKCDGGMGKKRFGKLTAWVGDPLGLFEYQITEEPEDAIEVYPRIEAVPEPRVGGSRDSFLFGDQDVPVRGQSVNFMGIRDYVPGDSPRQISWKLSQKHRKLLVKEFEKAVNAEITFVLDMQGSLHLGRGADSTWETAKALVLALMATQARSSNSLQFITQGTHLPFGRGPEHFDRLARSVSALKPTELAQRRAHPLDNTGTWQIPPHSSVFYVAPVLSQDSPEDWSQLLILREREVRIRTYLIDPTAYAKGGVPQDFRAMIDGEIYRMRANLEHSIEILGRNGVETFVILDRKALARALETPRDSRTRGVDL